MEKKKVIKLFLTWQDEKEQSWLEKKAANGLILDEVGFLNYIFHKGEPKNIHYRLDYQEINENELPEYLELFTDAGWKYKGRMNNWFYFASEEDKIKEIYTDVHSKVQKYKRVLRTLAIACLCSLSSLGSFANFSEHAISPFVHILIEGFRIFVLLLSVFLVFNTVRLAILINKMEKDS